MRGEYLVEAARSVTSPYIYGENSENSANHQVICEATAFLPCNLPQEPEHIDILQQLFVVMVGVGCDKLHTVEVVTS